jgi:hypothetical protein
MTAGRAVGYCAAFRALLERSRCLAAQDSPDAVEESRRPHRRGDAEELDGGNRRDRGDRRGVRTEMATKGGSLLHQVGRDLAPLFPMPTNARLPSNSRPEAIFVRM